MTELFESPVPLVILRVSKSWPESLRNRLDINIIRQKNRFMLHCIWAHCCANAKITLLFGIMDLFELFVVESYNEISYLCEIGPELTLAGAKIMKEDTSVILAEAEAAIAALPESRRKIYKMRFIEGLSVHEISERLDISPKIVEPRLHVRNAVSVRGFQNIMY